MTGREPPFGGALTALVTPFTAGGTGIDERSLGDLVAAQVAAGTEGLVVGGPTGEGPTLTEAERDRVVRVVVAAAEGRIPVIVASGTNCTRTAIDRTLAAEAAGAAATLAVTSYYSRPTQEGLTRHCAAIAAACGRPLLLHADPARTGMALRPETLARLAALPRIAGLVDAAGDLDSLGEVARAAGPGFPVLCGNDAAAVAHGAMGGLGCVSVIANLVPGPCAALQRAIRAGDHARARAIQAGLAPLIAALSLETDPAPVKLALARLRPGVAPDLRLPLVRPRPETEAAVAAALDLVRSREPAQG
ncbi:4-hydroxy-tetrahydrodipicolinate synthase [Methylobacterium sp. EM32]|uniref:4-hydroxy-tetrahydrodipicolinate synthase n=1 Tax=Methylobacterium sp. EM32 TaxID=3163481 RepID=UPI0033B7C65B